MVTRDSVSRHLIASWQSVSRVTRNVSRERRRRTIASIAWCAVAMTLSSSAHAQEQPAPPSPSFNFNPRPKNVLIGTSGPEWGGGRGAGRFSGVDYERFLTRRVTLRLAFGQSYNGNGEERVDDFVLSGIPVRQTDVLDFNRLVLGAQLGYAQPLTSGSRVLVFAGPTFTRVSSTERRFLTDLRNGDTLETGRRSIGSNDNGLLYGGGVEFDIADHFAYRVVVLHNTAGTRDATTLAIGGAVKF